MRRYFKKCICSLGALVSVPVLASLQLPAPADSFAAVGLPAQVIPVVDQSATTSVPNVQEMPPQPDLTIEGKHLSLSEAILLALRNNPQVLSAQYKRILDKYDVEIANNAFQPQYSLDINQTFQNHAKPIYDVTPSAQLKTTLGTEFSVNNSFSTSGTQTTNLSVTQHLLKGFGSVNSIAYLDQMDAAKTAKLDYKTSITNIVMSVVADYRSLVSAELNLTINQKNLAATKQSTQDDELRFKAGKLARSELVQQQATLASAQLSYQSQLNALKTTYQNFLVELGVSPWSKFIVDKTVSTPVVKLPPLQTCIELAMKNNPDYQTQVINLQSTYRGIQLAKDQMKWSLDATVSQPLESTSADYGFPVTVDDVQAKDPSFTLNMQMPTNRLENQKALVSAKIAYAEAKAELEQSKRELMIKVQNQYQTILYDQQQIPIGEQSVQLEKMALENMQMKFKYGKATALDVATVQNSFVDAQSSLVSYQISLLNDLLDLDNTLGRVLDQWGITLRY